MVGAIISIIGSVLELWLMNKKNGAEALMHFYKFAHSVNKNHLGNEKAAKKWDDQAALLAAKLAA